MNDSKRFRTGVWKQPEDQWSNDAGCISGIEAVRGSKGNEYKPADEGKIAAKKPGDPGHNVNVYFVFRGYNAAAPETTSMISFVIAA